MNFLKIAPYLADPLVLIGFFLFIAFSFSRLLLKSGIIPPVGAGRGAGILRLLLHYGFIIGILIIILGFGLKYRELSKKEQINAVGIMRSELLHNLHVVDELKKNTETLSNASDTVMHILRDERFPIASGLFPKSNVDTDKEQDPDLYNKRFDWLQSSGLLEKSDELAKHNKQAAAIVRSINRTESTIRSLGDRDGNRYVIHRQAFDSNLPIMRKIQIADVQDIAELYSKSEETRQEYFRVSDSVIEYLVSVRIFCETSPPDRAELGAALASERLTARLLEDSANSLITLSKQTAEIAQRLAFQNPEANKS